MIFSCSQPPPQCSRAESEPAGFQALVGAESQPPTLPSTQGTQLWVLYQSLHGWEGLNQLLSLVFSNILIPVSLQIIVLFQVWADSFKPLLLVSCWNSGNRDFQAFCAERQALYLT